MEKKPYDYPNARQNLLAPKPFSKHLPEKAAALTQPGKMDCFQFLESTSLKHPSRRKAYGSIPMSLVYPL